MTHFLRVAYIKPVIPSSAKMLIIVDQNRPNTICLQKAQQKFEFFFSFFFLRPTEIVQRNTDNSKCSLFVY